MILVILNDAGAATASGTGVAKEMAMRARAVNVYFMMPRLVCRLLCWYL